MKKYLVIVECAIECQGKYLIIRRPEGKHAGGLLAFAGGKVEEQDEANGFDMLRAAVKREILEELGLDLVEKVDYITSEFFVDSSGIHSINNLFHYKYDEMPVVMPCEREVPWFAWMTKDEINNAPNSPEWLKVLIKLV
jgi:8-oxo-dGTP pyrophosphatase MutT (NUDIX family)